MNDDDDEIQLVHRATQQVLDRIRPHVVQLAVTVEALERAIEAERETQDG